MRALIFILCLFLPVSVAWAQTAPPTPSGLALPRFASLKFEKIYARAGPDQNYPINWVYQREGMPVEITQEYGDWRKIRDMQGGEGWVHKIQLSGKRTVIIRALGTTALTEKPDLKSPTTAQVESQVIAKLDKCDPQWCRVVADGYRGWIGRNLLWGIYPAEDLR